MTHEDLTRLLDVFGLDGSPLELDLAALHVPYDDRGRGGVEAVVQAAARRAERIGLCAPIGAGKTSVLRYCLDHVDSDVAPIWISVARDRETLLQDPHAFLAHVIQAIARHATNAQQISDADREEILRAATEKRLLPARARRLGGKLSAKFWLANAELSRDVTLTMPSGELPRPLQDLRDLADELLHRVFASHELTPCLVIDDSDAFTRVGRPGDHEALVGSFFGPVLGEIARQRCGLVVAVHDSYPTMPAFREAQTQWTGLRIVDVPEILSGQLRRILQRRVHATTGGDAHDVFTSQAIDRLTELNRGPARRNLRTVLGITHEALNLAWQDGRDHIDEHDVTASAVKYLG
ncbi:hypothetical protein GKE82_24495 [Conexibacter sp. W3-3-2]|uniref:hypothetical protein n=1 Tax=Conexibacter sp. W3-3-2 TaxID=2675227 RepID=UPI0012B99640|nr:hypothetical protein [Conexibacter sp. W3-3-2]MTD47370.1 hypothetical protein [Conexibacter sp. W3-3-2]